MITENKNVMFQNFINDTNTIVENIIPFNFENDIKEVKDLIANFQNKTNDFFKENRKLNIGVVGQVKAGKSSFLNTLLFDGKEILPKASTPKTATLTKMEYSDKNIIEIEYYGSDEWENLEECAAIDLDEEVFISARELINMAKKNGINAREYIEKGIQKLEFVSYDELTKQLNDYVGENGKYTAVVKSVTLYLNKEEFKGLSIVDTPGLNDPIVSRTIRTKEFMEVCDVVFFLSQSGSFLDKSDWTLLSSQLPQKGVKKLVLIASKYDSGIRDVLRKKDDDDIFGDDDNVSDTVSGACKILKTKLKRRAKQKVEEFVMDLQSRNSMPELIDTIKECSNPILISSIANNMTNKTVDDYDSEEKNIYSAIKLFSNDILSDLKSIGNFEEVRKIFDNVVLEKEKILDEKSCEFIPRAQEELKSILGKFVEIAEKKVRILTENDKNKIIDQKNLIEKQINAVKSDLSVVFGELNSKIETEKNSCIKDVRTASKEYIDIRDRVGSSTKTGSYTTGHLWWKKTETYTYEEHYSYYLASDACENLKKYSVDASNTIENVFLTVVDLKELKRKLINVIISDFDTGSEKYDSSLFKIMVEDAVAKIEFPVIKLSVSDKIDSITAQFTGELTSAGERNSLAIVLEKAITKIYDELCDKLLESVKEFKEKMTNINAFFEETLLKSILEEFDSLIEQCNNKEHEISNYTNYINILNKELTKI